MSRATSRGTGRNGGFQRFATASNARNGRTRAQGRRPRRRDQGLEGAARRSPPEPRSMAGASRGLEDADHPADAGAASPRAGAGRDAEGVRAAPIMVSLVVRLAGGRLGERSVAFETRVRPRSLACQWLERASPVRREPSPSAPAAHRSPLAAKRALVRIPKGPKPQKPATGRLRPSSRR